MRERSSLVSLFILTIMLETGTNVNRNITLCVKVTLTTAHGAIYRANPWT